MRYLSLIWISFLTVFPTGLPAEDHARTGQSAVSSGDTDSQPSFSSIVGAIDAGAWSLEAVLKSLSPDYRSNYSLVFDSRSLQSATRKNPRVIFYGKDAKLLLAFNGDPSLPGFGNLEIIRYNDLTRRFEFHEIRFSADGKTKPQIVRSPTNCVLCHGEPPLPRWDTYRLWPGVFGTDDDGVLFHPGGVTQFPTEARWYGDFQKTRQQEQQAHKGLYRFLEEPQAAYSGDVRPNTQLSSLLGTLTRDSIAATVRLDPRLKPLRYALAAIFTKGCENMPGFFPKDLEPQIQDLLSRIAQNVNSVNRAAETAKNARLRALMGDAAGSYVTEISSTYPSPYYDAQTASLRLLIEGFSNHRLIDWGMEFEPRSYNFDLNGPLTNGGDFTRAWVLDTDKTFDASSFYWSCDKLRKKQQEAFPWNADNRRKLLAAIEKVKDLKVPEPSAPFEKCVTCHLPGNKASAPVIPFSNRRALIDLLSENSALRNELINRLLPYPEGGKATMPLGLPFTDVERQAVRDFLSKI